MGHVAVAQPTPPSPLEGEGARRADEGYSFLHSACSSAEVRIPLTLEFLLDEEIPVPLPQGAREGKS
jgi:hypothetical protein